VNACRHTRVEITRSTKATATTDSVDGYCLDCFALLIGTAYATGEIEVRAITPALGQWRSPEVTAQPCVRCDEADALPGKERCAPCNESWEQDGPQSEADCYPSYSASYTEQAATAWRDK
jgi:hypothetical protein